MPQREAFSESPNAMGSRPRRRLRRSFGGVSGLIDGCSKTIDELQDDVFSLEQQLKAAKAENDEKDRRIASLEAQLSNQHEMDLRSNNLQHQLNTYMRSRMNHEHDQKPPIPTEILDSTASSTESAEGIAANPNDACSLRSKDAPARDVVNEIQRWLFLEGGNLRDVKSLITEYCNFMRSVGIPIDRLFIAGMMLHPSISAYVWKWEVNEEFNEHEVPHSAFVKPNYNPEEPFAVLMEGRSMNYRMTQQSENIPSGCKWFLDGKYQDYYALPIYHRGAFKGAMAWCTRTMSGWNDKHIQIFEDSLAALSTVLRLHTNDIVTRTLTGRLEEEVQTQTSELEKANTNLAEANQLVLKQSEAQLKHFAMMSHEIRTPLNCIVGLTNLLLVEDELPSSIRESLEMITSSGDLLLAVVNDVLDYAKLASGNVDTNMKVCNIQSTINTVVYAIRSRAQEYGITLCTDLSDLPSKLHTDSRRLQQILYNLLGNAIKFGKRGKKVDFSVKTKDQSVVFSIRDYGIGISPEEIDYIFEPFQQSTKNDPVSHGGTGLGLAITRQLVLALDGEISVQSELNQWCEFQVELPWGKHGEKEDLLDGDLDLDCLDRSNHTSLSGESDELDDLHSSGILTSYCADGSNHSGVSLSLYNLDLDDDKNDNEKDPAPAPQIDPSTAKERLEKPPKSAKSFVAEIITSTAESNNAVNSKPIEKSKQDSGLSQKSLYSLSSFKTAPSSTLSHLKILIAEDNLINQKVLLRTLKRLGVSDVDVAENGQLAVEASLYKTYDVIFMDLQMPVMDGLEATTIISQREEHPHIIFLTAHALKDYQDQAAKAGGDGFISKPFKVAVIQDMLEKYAQKQIT